MNNKEIAEQLRRAADHLENGSGYIGKYACDPSVMNKGSYINCTIQDGTTEVKVRYIKKWNVG